MAGTARGDTAAATPTAAEEDAAGRDMGVYPHDPCIGYACADL